MGIYTVTTTNDQDAILADYLVIENARRARGNALPPLTAALAVQLAVEGLIETVDSTVEHDKRATLRQAITEATPEQKAAIRAILAEP